MTPSRTGVRPAKASSDRRSSPAGKRPMVRPIVRRIAIQRSLRMKIVPAPSAQRAVSPARPQPSTPSAQRAVAVVGRGGFLVGVALPVFQARTGQSFRPLPDPRHGLFRHRLELLRNPDVVFDLPDRGAAER